MAININTNGVTQEELNRVSRIWDGQKHEYFCQVESERDNTVVYEVRYHKDTHTFSCTCRSGQEGFANCHNPSGYCKHVRWSVAYCKALRAEQAEQSYLESLVRQGLSRDEATRVAYAKPFVPTAQELRQAAMLNKGRVFSLYR